MNRPNLHRAVLHAGIALLIATACSDSGSNGDPTDPSVPEEPTPPEQPGQPEEPAPPEDPGQPDVTACGLVTDAEFETILGTPLGAGDETSGPSGITTCSYVAPDFSSIIIRLSPEIGDQEHAAFPYVDPQPVEGLGEDALFAAQAKLPDETSTADFGSVLSVVQGTVEISIFYNGEGDRLAISVAMAEAALARL